MLQRMNGWSRARSLGALFGVTLMIVGCGGGGGSSGVKASGSTTTNADAATSTTVPEPINDDDLSDLLLGVSDIGGPWRQEGPIAIGKREVVGYNDDSNLKMSCDGKAVELPDQSKGFEGMAAVAFSQAHDYPILVQELASDDVKKLEANVKALVDIYSACDKGKLEVDGVQGTARIQQFALPDVGADEIYGFNISSTMDGITINSVNIVLRKGTVVSTLEYSAIEPPDENTVANIAALAVDKIAGDPTN